MDFNRPDTPEENPSPNPLLEVREARRAVAFPCLAVAFIFLLASVLQIPLILIADRIDPAITETDWFVWAVGMLPMYAVAMPLSLLFYRLAPASPPEKRKLHPLAWFGLLAVCFSLTYVGNILGDLVNRLISAVTGQPVVNELESLTTSSPLWTNLLFAGILAPILEELFYRKLLLDRWRRFGDLPAILLSGILFGLIHGNFNQFFYAAGIGILFGYVYLRTGDIRYTIALHLSVNLIGGVFASEILKRVGDAGTDLAALLGDPPGFLMLTGYSLFQMAAWIATPIALILLIPKVRFSHAEHPLTARQWLRVLLLNPGVWVLAATVVLLFL